MEQVTIIKPKPPFSLSEFKEIWDFRELFYFLSWRDIKVQYKQTIIGIAWAIFKPFITMVVFSIFFGQMAKIPSEGIPYPIFVYIGLLWWQFFSTTLTGASNSLLANKGIVTKIYFPRIILPFSSMITNLVDFFIAGFILLGLMIYYHYIPHLLGFILLPLILIITVLISVGGGLFLSSLNIKYRDIKHILPFFIQIFLFITPVIYPSSLLKKYAWILAINPMTGVISTTRAAFLGNAPVPWGLLFISAIIGILIFIIGLILFKKTEKYFADLV